MHSYLTRLDLISQTYHFVNQCFWACSSDLILKYSLTKGSESVWKGKKNDTITQEIKKIRMGRQGEKIHYEHLILGSSISRMIKNCRSRRSEQISQILSCPNWCSLETLNYSVQSTWWTMLCWGSLFKLWIKLWWGNFTFRLVYSQGLLPYFCSFSPALLHTITIFSFALYSHV